MSVVNPNQLKQYFQTGNVPTQANFADLIDSTFNKLNGLIYSGGLTQPLQGTVSNTVDSNIVNGINTQFRLQLRPGAAIQIGNQIYTVDTIPTNTQLTVTTNIVPAATNVSAYTEGTPLLFENYQSQVLVTLTPQGFFGIGTATPSSALQVVGTIQATSFTGSGAGLTGLSMNNIAGNLDASRISGTLQAAQFPLISASNISGTLAPNQIPDLASRTVLFYCATPCVQSGTQVTLNWLSDPSYSLMLSYVADSGIVNTPFTTTAPSNTGSTTLSVSQTTVYTLTATANNSVVAQHQLQIVVPQAVPQTPTAYISALKANGTALDNIVALCAAKFNLETLNTTNIGVMAQALKGANFAARDIYQNVQQYYGFAPSDKKSILYMEELIKILGILMDTFVLNTAFPSNYTLWFEGLQDTYLAWLGAGKSTTLADFSLAVYTYWTTPANVTNWPDRITYAQLMEALTNLMQPNHAGDGPSSTAAFPNAANITAAVNSYYMNISIVIDADAVLAHFKNAASGPINIRNFVVMTDNHSDTSSGEGTDELVSEGLQPNMTITWTATSKNNGHTIQLTAYEPRKGNPFQELYQVPVAMPADPSIWVTKTNAKLPTSFSVVYSFNLTIDHGHVTYWFDPYIGDKRR